MRCLVCVCFLKIIVCKDDEIPAFSAMIETVNLTENDAKSLSKAPCLVALNMYLTLHLLFFG